MNLSPAEVNYIAAIQKLSIHGERVSTNALAKEFNIAPASVTDMVQRLSEKEFVYYEKYKGVSLLPAGEEIANQANVSDAIWIQFFKDKLAMSEQEIELALDHFRKVQSKTVLRKLKQFLATNSTLGVSAKQSREQVQSTLFDQEILAPVSIPEITPVVRESADVVSSKFGNHHKKLIQENINVESERTKLVLSQLNKGETCYILGVEALESDFLKLLQVHQLIIGTQVRILDRFEFDNSIRIEFNGQNLILSQKIAESILIDRA